MDKKSILFSESLYDNGLDFSDMQLVDLFLSMAKHDNYGCVFLNPTVIKVYWYKRFFIGSVYGHNPGPSFFFAGLDSDSDSDSELT